MTVSIAIFLGIVQGLTEFLPISSSGHLVIFQNMFGLKKPELLFDLMLHFGTLVAVAGYFIKDITNMIAALLRGSAGLLKGERLKDVVRRNPDLKLLTYLVIGSLPAFFVGYFFRSTICFLFSSLTVVGGALMLNGVMLWFTKFSDKGKRGFDEFGSIDAVIIGIFQSVAITPGVSRSGAVISGALFRKVNREFSARFGFLLSIPAILGGILSEHALFSEATVTGVLAVFLGTLTACVVGIFAIRTLMRIVVKGNFHNFSYYSFAVGLLVFIASFFVK